MGPRDEIQENPRSSAEQSNPSSSIDMSSSDSCEKDHAYEETQRPSMEKYDTKVSEDDPDFVKHEHDEEPAPRFGLQHVSQLMNTFYHKFKIYIHFFIWLLITAYFIASMAIRNITRLTDVLPLILLYVFITGKMFFHFVPTTVVSRPVGRIFDICIKKPVMAIPRKVTWTIFYIVPVAFFLLIAMCMPTTHIGTRLQRLQGFFGMIIIIFVLAITSKYPKRIPWHTVAVGQSLQLILGLIVLKTNWGYQLFRWIAEQVSAFLEFGSNGAAFIFGADSIKPPVPFAISVFPALIFFAAFIQMCYYLGGMQWLVLKVSWFFNILMDTSGAESVVAAGSPFVGQNETALLIKSYVKDLTTSELHTMMCAGFSTISGSVLMGYVSMGVDPQWLITASVMSVPCSLAMSKIRIPEIDHPLTKGNNIELENKDEDVNLLHAAGNGASAGVMLSLMIGGSLIAIISLLAFVNFMLTWFGNFLTIKNLTLQMIIGYILYPFTWLLGVPTQDVLHVSQLLGLKLVANEFVAYQHFTQTVDGEPPVKDLLTDRSKIIAQFALAGFANLGSIGIQIGSIGGMAPSRKGDVARLALSAVMTGMIATCMSALIAGMVL